MNDEGAHEAGSEQKVVQCPSCQTKFALSSEAIAAKTKSAVNDGLLKFHCSRCDTIFTLSREELGLAEAEHVDDIHDDTPATQLTFVLPDEDTGAKKQKEPPAATSERRAVSATIAEIDAKLEKNPTLKLPAAAVQEFLAHSATEPGVGDNDPGNFDPATFKEVTTVNDEAATEQGNEVDAAADDTAEQPGEEPPEQHAWPDENSVSSTVPRQEPLLPLTPEHQTARGVHESIIDDIDTTQEEFIAASGGISTTSIDQKLDSKTHSIGKSYSRWGSFFTVSIPILAALFFVGSLAGALYLSPLQLGKVLQSAYPGLRASPPNSLYISRTRFKIVRLESGELGAVIRGTIVNRSKEPYKNISVEGALFDKSGAVLEALKIPAANVLSKTPLHSLKSETILATQKNPPKDIGTLAAGSAAEFSLTIISPKIKDSNYYVARVYSARNG